MSGLNDSKLIEQSQVEVFAHLFAGRGDAWGAISGGCIKQAVTLDHYRRHIAGKVSLGIYPLRNDSCCRWFALDIDQDDVGKAIKIAEVLNSIGFNLGVYVERSKSKGYHVWSLLSDWMSARDIRRIAKHVIQLAGFPPSLEVFPKQDTTDGLRYGNYLNLPYFGGDNAQGRRMFIDVRTLCPTPLGAWLCEAQVFPVDALTTVLENVPPMPARQQGHAAEEMVDMLSQAIAVGERRPTLIKLAGYLRHRGIPEEVAVALLLSWAEKRFMEPLPPEELERHIRGIYGWYGIKGHRVAKPSKSWYAEVPL